MRSIVLGICAVSGIATVHAQAMKVLLALPPEEQAARTAILTNLHEVLRKKLPASDQSTT